MDMIRLILGFLRAFVLPRTALAAENLALRQQITVLQRSAMPRRSTSGGPECRRSFISFAGGALERISTPKLRWTGEA